MENQDLVDEKTKELVNKLAREAVQIADALAPVQKQIFQFNQSLTGLGEIINNTVTQFTQNVVFKMNVTLKPLEELAKNIVELEERFRLTEGEAVKILTKYKWFFTPNMPIHLLYDVVRVELEQKATRGKINRVFVDFYTSNNFSELEEVVDSWRENRIVKQRYKILRDCFVVLKECRGKYNASNVILPTLIAQIDGILTAQLSFEKRNKDFRTKLQEKTRDEYLPELLQLVLFERLFQYSNKVDKEPFTFSRHKVMHGQSTTYGRVDNSIRAFMMIDFLAELR